MKTWKVHRRSVIFEVAHVDAETKEQALAEALDNGNFEFVCCDEDEIVAMDEIGENGEPVMYLYFEDGKCIGEDKA